MNMISQTIENFLQTLCDILGSGMPTGFGTKMEQVVSTGNNMLSTIIPTLLLAMDDEILKDPQRREDWEVVRKDKRTLVAAFGELCFERRYYRHKESGEMAYLLDRYLGIQSNAKVNGDVRGKAVAMAEQGAYSKSASGATQAGLSRMSVCNYVSHLERFPALEAQGDKRAVKQLYVEADEDHVSLQDGKKAQVKLIYVHEGVQERGERRMLVNPRYLTWPQESDADSLWETVSHYIDGQYDLQALEQIFLSGDCASWIRKGEEWLYPCVPILDGFHAMKALRKLCGGRQEQAAAFLRHVWKDEFNLAKDLCKSILKETPEPKRKAKHKQANYLLNNWHRIRNQRHPGAQGCSAEGHVSHILSERLSSRPLGWSKRNMENMARLRVMKANGQVIQYEELRRAMPRKDNETTHTGVDALVNTPRLRRALKKSALSSLNNACHNLPILTNGATTQLYRALHALSFDSLAS